ncbi:MAG: YtxH domain-containing protein [Cyclobacteriaceae bacterium]|jgi:gas vesicle protein|nr:YtxH domain-containing protein [Cyclobacteriaceae bacterium]
MKTRKAILAVAIGIVAGGLIGVLFAPEKGAETRKSMKKRRDAMLKDLNREIDKRFRELANTLPEDYSRLSRLMQEPLEEMSEV